MNLIYSLCHNIFYFLVVISFLIFVHEMGHYLIAKFFNVHVEAFSLGFGKEICGITDKSGTRWKISALPIGGYVKMLGDKDPASSPDLDLISHLTEEEKLRSFYTKSPLQKFLIVFAGPFANFLLALVIMTNLSFSHGKAVIDTEIRSLVPDMPAFDAGLMAGDIILKLDNKDVKEFSDIETIIALHVQEDKPILFQIKRRGEIFSKEIFPKKMIIDDGFGGKMEVNKIGILSNPPKYQELSKLEALSYSVQQIYNISYMTLAAMGQIITGERNTDQLSGPIKIAKYSGETAKKGINFMLAFMAIISINLGLVNLLPVPLLDGGHLVMYVIEFFRGKPLEADIQNMLVKIGSILLFGLMIFSTFNDLKSVIFPN